MEQGDRCQAFPAMFVLLLSLSLLPQALSAQTYVYNQAAFWVGSKPSAIAVADFNQDGRLDFAVTNESDNTVSVVLSRPDGSFAPKVDYRVGTAPRAVVSADFNGDRIPDLAVTNSIDNTVSVLLGVGDGTFVSKVACPTGAFPVAIVAADFNGDTKLDLAVANQGDGTVSVLPGNCDGTFQSQSKTTIVSSPMAIVTADFNGDGKSDLFAANSQGYFSLLLNNGNGGFAVSPLGIGGTSAGGLVVGDFNGDGISDIAITNPADKELVIFVGNGNGTFRLFGTPLSATAKTVAVGDFDNDGKLDVALGTYLGSALGDGVVYSSSLLILRGNGDGTFQQPIANDFPDLSPDYRYPMAVGDFNNDNYLDLAVVVTSDNTVIVYLGQGNGIAGSHIDFTLPASEGIAGSATADFNGDGKLDVSVAQFTQILDPPQDPGFITILRGNGDGTFQPPITTPLQNVGLGEMVTGDFNGDGKVDIAMARVGNGSDTLVVLGNGDGTFGSPVSSPVNVPGLNVQYMIGGDFNNDGRADLALLSLQSSNALSDLYVLLSRGDGTFEPKLVDSVYGIANQLTAGDFNSDGHLDIALGDPYVPDVLFYLGHGDGTFAHGTGLTFSGGVDVGDFNGDGKIDLAEVGPGRISFLAGRGDGTFQLPVDTAIPFGIYGTFVGDFNGDGRSDLALPFRYGQNVSSVVLANADGSFQAPLSFVAPYFPRRFIAGDFNSDGSFDLMQFSRASSTFHNVPVIASVWYSAPAVSFSASRLDFAPHAVGSGSSKSILLTNSGNAPLSISSITITGPFAKTSNCPIWLGVGQGCTINVSFAPTAIGPNSGSITFADDARPGTQILPLTGSAVPPRKFLIQVTSD